VITELNIADNNLANGGSDMSGVIALAHVIPTMGALSVLNLAKNGLGELVLPEGWTKEYDPDEDEEVYRHTDGREQKDKPGKPEGIIAIANAIPDMGALSVANVMGNNIGKEQLSKLQEIMRSKPNLMSLCGIPDDATEADLSGIGIDADDAIILVSELPGKGALSVLNLASNNLGELVLPQGWSEDWIVTLSFCSRAKEYTHTDGSKQDQHPGKPEGIIALANAISDMRAISSANLLENGIPMEQAKALASILKEHPTLKSLCGNSGEEMEVDMSGKMNGAEDATMLAAEIIGNGALMSLNLSSNDLEAEGTKIVAEAIKVTTCAISVVLAPLNLMPI
jgi:hypothetical protein